jgi:hypothetical protein
MISGGCTGADYIWTNLALNYLKTKVTIMSFHGHYQIKLPDSKLINVIKVNNLQEADDHLKKAAKNINKIYKTNALLQRNYFIVKDVDAVFAVGYILNGIIQGGTGWACNMAINLNKPVFLYDMSTRKWTSFNHPDVENPKINDFENVALIGSRDVKYNGLCAMIKSFH